LAGEKKDSVNHTVTSVPKPKFACFNSTSGANFGFERTLEILDSGGGSGSEIRFSDSPIQSSEFLNHPH
jgi:hypothetical protein